MMVMGSVTFLGKEVQLGSSSGKQAAKHKKQSRIDSLLDDRSSQRVISKTVADSFFSKTCDLQRKEWRTTK
jgi:hypothetical protein